MDLEENLYEKIKAGNQRSYINELIQKNGSDYSLEIRDALWELWQARRITSVKAAHQNSSRSSFDSHFSKSPSSVVIYSEDFIIK